MDEQKEGKVHSKSVIDKPQLDPFSIEYDGDVAIGYITRVEYVFTVLPVVVSAIVLSFDGRFYELLLGPEWSFISAVLAGQIVVKQILMISLGDVSASVWRQMRGYLPEEEHVDTATKGKTGYFTGQILRARSQSSAYEFSTMQAVIGLLLLVVAIVLVVLAIITSAERGESIRSWVLGVLSWLLFLFTTYRYFIVSKSYEYMKSSDFIRSETNWLKLLLDSKRDQLEMEKELVSVIEKLAQNNTDSDLDAVGGSPAPAEGE